MNIFVIVLPIFLIILLGYALKARGLVEESWVHVLNSFVYYVSLPAIILVSFWEINWSEKSILPAVGFNVLAVLAFAILLALVLSRFKLDGKIKAAIFMAAVVGNTVYMGFPIMQEAFGAENFAHVTAIATPHLILNLILAIVMIEFWVVKSRKLKTYFYDFIKNPLVLGLLFGVLLSLLQLEGYHVQILKKPLSMLGATASPVALFALGAFIHGKFIQKHFGLTVLVSALKLIVFPLFVLLLTNWFSLSSIGISVSALVAAMPVAVTTFVIAEQYKLDKAFVANAILISTAVSIVTISMFLLKLV